MIYKEIPENFSPRFETVSCYVENNGELLLLLRQTKKSEGNKWGLPAGKIDEGENKIDAMGRELGEETGLKIPKTEIKYLTTVYIKYPEYDFIFHMFRALFNTRPSIGINVAEHQDYKWISAKEAQKLDLVKDLGKCIKMIYEIQQTSS